MGALKRIDWQATIWLLVACLVIGLSGCDFGGASLAELQEWFNNHNNSGGVVQDTITDPATCDSLGQAEGPQFISGALEWDFPVDPDSVLWHYENYESFDLAEVIYTAAIDMGIPIDSVHVWATDSGFAYLVDGTSNHTPWLVAIWTRANSTSGGVISHCWPDVTISNREAKWYLPATSMGFYFGPILTFDQYKAVAMVRPNVESWNVRSLVATPEQCMELGGIILGDCIEGRRRADFRWGTWEPFIFDYYESAGWDEVITP